MATLGFLGDLLGLNNGDPTIDAANKNRTAVSDYGTKATGIINNGAAQAGGYLGQAKDLYSPLADLATKASTTYGDALGLNGPAGNAAATSAFQTSPGYDFTRDQALQGVDRSAAAHGLTGSGNWINGAETTASGLANNEYGSWLDRLANPGSLISGGIAGESNALGNLANLSTNTANSNAGVATDVLNGSLGVNNQQASGETANSEGLSSLFGNIVGGGLSLATGGLSNLGKVGNIFGNAKQGAAGNVFGYGGF